jgi:AcrR family transcriptional regulator
MTSPTRDLRQQSILDAALSVISDHGLEQVTMAELAKRTGLSRPAIYQYFASREDVLAELLINEMADLSNEIERICESVQEPMERVRIWVHYSLAHLASAEHRLVRNISIQSLPEEKRGMLQSMHGYFMANLISPLKELGLDDPAAVCSLVYASVASTASRIDEGGDFAEEARSLEKFVVSGIEVALPKKQ